MFLFLCLQLPSCCRGVGQEEAGRWAGAELWSAGVWRRGGSGHYGMAASCCKERPQTAAVEHWPRFDDENSRRFNQKALLRPIVCVPGGGRSGVLVEFSAPSFYFRSYGDLSDEEMDRVCQFLHSRVQEQERTQLFQLTACSRAFKR